MTEINGFKSTLAIAWQWLVIAMAIICFTMTQSVFIYIISVIVIGTRQHALGILVHDACHFRLYKNRKVNDNVANIFAGYPVGMSAALYRKWHLPHHRHANTPRDPELTAEQVDPEMWIWPKKSGSVLKIFAKDMLGINVIKTIKMMMVWCPISKMTTPSKNIGGLMRAEKVVFSAFSLSLILFFTYFQLWVEFVLLWMIPYLTVLSFIFKLRSFAEHKVVKNKSELSNTRTVIPHFIEKLLIAPLNVNYHLEHHLFPSIPFFNLGKISDILNQDSLFVENAHITNGYILGKTSLVKELTQRV